MKQCLSHDKTARPSFVEISSKLEELIPPVIFTKLDPNSDEYHQVDEMFYTQGSQGNGGSLTRDAFRIVEITKVKNEFTEREYEASKLNIQRELKSDDVNERMMFHGTRRMDPFEIAKHRHGMMKDFSGDGFYGQGIYFAESSRYSHDERYRHQTSIGQHQMMVCSVICGNSVEMGQQINREMRQRNLPPNKHSVMGGPHCPSRRGPGDDDSRMVVIYKDSQCTPRYIITYETI
jgi:hypothetical protein